jgi:hypothetical protein
MVKTKKLGLAKTKKRGQKALSALLALSLAMPFAM